MPVDGEERARQTLVPASPTSLEDHRLPIFNLVVGELLQKQS